MKKITHKLILISLLFNTFRMFIGATSTVYLINKGFLENEIAVLRMFQFIIILLVDIPLGYIADKYSRKLSILLGILFSSIWLFLVAMVRYKPLIYVGEAFNALSLAFWGGAFISLLINTYKKEEGHHVDTTKIIAKHSQLTMFSMAIGSFVNVFFPLQKLDSLWMLSGSLCLMLFAISYFMIPSDQMERKPVHNYREDLKKDIYAIRAILMNKSLFLVALIFILAFALFNIIVNYTQIVTYSNLPEFNKSHVHAMVFTLVLGMQSVAGYSMKKIDIPISFLTMSMVILFMILCFSSMALLNVVLWILHFFLFRCIIISVLEKIHNDTSDEIRATVDSVLRTGAMITAIPFSMIVYVGYENIRFIYVFSLIVFGITFMLYVLHVNIKRG